MASDSRVPTIRTYHDRYMVLIMVTHDAHTVGNTTIPTPKAAQSHNEYAT
jgi:hypothetical protein